MKLYDAEWLILNKLARVSKMDCWFVLRGNDSHDWCYDAENSTAISLKRAIKELDEGLTEDDLEMLAGTQKKIYRQCLKRLGISGTGSVRNDALI